MSTGSLRRRVMAAVLGLLLIVVVAFGTLVTVAYRQSREDDVRNRLTAGARRPEARLAQRAVEGPRRRR